MFRRTYGLEVKNREKNYQLDEEIDMNGIFSLAWKDVLGAIVSTVLVTVIGYILSVGDIFAIDPKQVINIAVLAGLGSLVKSLGTDKNGKFAGAIKVK